MLSESLPPDDCCSALQRYKRVTEHKWCAVILNKDTSKITRTSRHVSSYTCLFAQSSSSDFSSSALHTNIQKTRLAILPSIYAPCTITIATTHETNPLCGTPCAVSSLPLLRRDGTCGSIFVRRFVSTDLDTIIHQSRVYKWFSL